jgi:hypothetical protein
VRQLVPCILKWEQLGPSLTMLGLGTAIVSPSFSNLRGLSAPVAFALRVIAIIRPLQAVLRPASKFLAMPRAADVAAVEDLLGHSRRGKRRRRKGSVDPGISIRRRPWLEALMAILVTLGRTL